MENILTELEVGCGLGQGGDGLAVGTEAARQALASIKRHQLSAVLTFASGRYDLEALLRGIRGVVGESPVLGATTAGEILNAPRQESVVVVALASPALRVKVGVGEGVSRNWQAAVNQAVSSPDLAPFFASQDDPIWSGLTLEGKSVFALLFSPGNTRATDSCSFEILEELKRQSHGRLPFIGGGAADDWRLENNYVLWGGRAYPDGMLVAVFETRLRFGIGLAHGFTPSSRRGVVTRSMDHEVLELDGQPASEVYCRLLGVSRDSLEGRHLTMATGTPLGIADPYGQYSINVATFFTPEGGVRFAQPVPEGTSLTVMEANRDRLVGAGLEALRKALLCGGISEPAVALVFSGALRACLLKERADEELASLKQMIPGAPVAGFYSFGEQGLADGGATRHQNAVISVLALGREFSYGAQVALENERLRSVAAQRDELLRANQALEREIAERGRVEADLRESEERFKLLFESAPDALFIHDPQGNLIDGNRAAEELVGYRREELIGKNFLTLPLLDPEKIPMVTELLAQTAQGKNVGPVENTLNRKDGDKVIVEIKSLPVNIQGETMILGIARDITERKRLENQLIQAQKMEAVGRLAGGVAHDFNNLLMAIMGYSEIMLAELHPKDPLHDSVRKIMEVAERAAALTRQLLAFSRKQILHPRVIDLNTMLTNLENMLRRLLGEDLDLTLDLAPGPAAVKADPDQMGQVIMNLAVNARDAMPQGGRLLIAIALVHLDEGQAGKPPGVPPGPYVKLTMSDNGAGMDPETRAHIFEPFFTTKEAGKGTGLGLSTVYGIISQSGGALEVESELGRGTTFQIYLPRIVAVPEVIAPAADLSAPAQGSETVLVVEDEDVLRGVVSKFLRRFGYTVLAAPHGGEALLLCERHLGPIHLLLTDVVMPQMSGRELAKRLASQRPDMKVLFMSGYTADEIGNQNGPEFSGPLLQKPFNPMVLAHKVRELLDADIASPGSSA